jgi:hypothetical protein
VTAAGRIAASLLATKLKAGKLPNPFRVRDVYRASWAGLGDPEDIVRAIEVLEDLHWVRGQDVRRPEGGRPAAHFTSIRKLGGYEVRIADRQPTPKRLTHPLTKSPIRFRWFWLCVRPGSHRIRDPRRLPA